MRQKTSHRRPKSATPRRARVRLESLEDRIEPSIGVLSSVDPTTAPQALFGTDLTEQVVHPAQPPQPGRDQQLFRFSLDTASPGQKVRFDVAPINLQGIADAAIGLYDAAGNLVASADSAPLGPSGLESLTASLDAGRTYVVGVFADPLHPAPAGYVFTVAPGPQIVNTPVVIDPGTGAAHVPIGLGQDAFNSPADPDFYPLNLTNAGASGTVTVTPAGPDVHPFATLLRRNTPTGSWVPIATAAPASGPAVLNITPPAGGSLTDAQYLLAMAPRDFNTAAGGYAIDVSTAPLAPVPLPAAQVAAATDLRNPPPKSPTQAELVRNDSLAGTAKVFRFRASGDGPATVALNSGSFPPVVSIYDATGTQLVGTATRTQAGTATVSFDAVAGTEYLVRAASTSGQGPFTLTLDTPLLAAQILFGADGTATAGPIAVGPSQGAKVYQLDLTSRDVLVVQVTAQAGADPVAPRVTLLAPDGTTTIDQAAAGQPLFLPVKLSGTSNPYFLEVAGTAGSDPVVVQLGKLRIPRQFDPSQLLGAELGLDGTLDPAPQAVAGFGGQAAVEYYQLLAAPGNPLTTLTAIGGLPLLARYEESGGVLRLADWQLPDAQTGQATLTGKPLANRLQGLAAFALGFAPNPQVQLHVATPTPVGVGVGAVPDLKVKPPVQTILKIDKVTLQSGFQQQLWQTILPYNLTGQIHVTLTPNAAQGPMVVKLSIYSVDPQTHALTFLTGGTNAAGQPLPLTLSQFGLGGATLLFRVEGTGAVQLGDGVYSIDLTVPTSNPFPFLLTGTSYWVFPGTQPDFGPSPPSPAVRGLIPAGEPITDIAQNQFGHGEATGTFDVATTTTAGYPNGPLAPTTDQIEVYRFWVVNPGSVAIKTVAEPGSQVNTTVRLYKAGYAKNGVLILQAINEVGSSQDWYPADRSAIDAQNYVTDFATHLKYDPSDTYPVPNSYGTGGGMYFAVVRNEEGSVGKYRIEVDTPAFPLAGDSQNHVTEFPVSAGTIPLNVPSFAPFAVPGENGSNFIHNDYVGFFPIQMPNYHNGVLTIDAQLPPPVEDNWQFDLFDANGNQLSASRTPVPPPGHTLSAFAVPDGMQTAYLRVKGPTPPAFVANVTLTTHLQLLTPVAPPAAFNLIPGFPLLSLAELPTDPFGNATVDDQQHDGRLHDQLAQSGDAHIYEFQAPSGAMTVTVTPVVPNDVSLRWGVYANGTLIGWGLGGATGQTFALPTIRQPGLSPDSDYDTTTYQTVAIRIEALGNATSTGNFTVSILSNAVRPVDNTHLADKPTGMPNVDPTDLVTEPARPLRSADLPVSPRTGTGVTVVPLYWLNGSLQPTTTTGLAWVLLSVPVQATGPATFQANVGQSHAGQTLRFDLYDSAGMFLATGTALVPANGIVVQPLAQATAGASYFLHVAVVTSPAATVALTASAPLPALQPINKPPATILDFDLQTLGTLTPAPDGTFSTITHGNVLKAIWVGQGGHAHLSALPDFNANNFSLALYRAHYYGAGELLFPHYDLGLVDYQSAKSGSFYKLDVDLDPGLYVLRAVGSSTTVLGDQIPAYRAEEVVLDPNQGDNLGAPRPFDRDQAEKPIMESFRARYYHVVAPPGSKGKFTAQATKVGTFTGDPVLGKAIMNLWTESNGLLSAVTLPDVLGQNHSPAVDQVALAPPGQDYWVSLSRSSLAGTASISTVFDVPKSGTPDLVVTDFALVPDNGQTLARVTVLNEGFATAGDTAARLNLTDASNHLTTADLDEFALGPFATRTRTFPFQPTGINDKAEYLTDFLQGKPAGNIEEISETNNTSGLHLLKEFDPHAPTVALQVPTELGQSISGNPNPNIWGRYVAGAFGPVADIHAAVSDDDLFKGFYKLPAHGLKVQDELLLIDDLAPDQTDYLLAKNFAFGGLEASGPDNLNQVQVWVEDAFGVTSPVDVRQVQVVPRPNWATFVDYDNATRKYTLTLNRALVAYGDPNDPSKPITVAQLTGFDMPGIGSLENQFLVEASSTVTAPLDPGPPGQTITGPLAAHVKLEAMSQDLIDQTFDGSAQPTDHLTISTNLKVDQLTLQPTALDLTFRLTDLDLFNYQTPKIPLFSYGVPGVASLDIDLQFSIDVFLNAAVTLVFSPDLLNDPLANAIPVGVGKPTFIEPSVTLGAEVSGEAEVLGFDLASLSGGVNFTLNVTVAVDPKGAPAVPLDEIPSHLGYDISGDLGVVFKAKVLGFKVWGFEPDPIHIDFGGNLPPDITQPLQGMLQQVKPTTGLLGTDPVGPSDVDPTPNIVIDPISGRGLFLQLVNADPADPHGNLKYAVRSGNTWAGLTALPQADSLSDPSLALTGDAPGAAVVAYLAEAPDPNQPFASRTLTDTLKAQEIRYRYFDGTNWLTEQPLTTDALYDSDPVTSFNATGQGVIAWVHNTAQDPAANGLDQKRGDIAVATWDPVAHTFGPAQFLTADPDPNPVADGKPSVYAADNSVLYAVWLRTANGVATPTFSAFVNGAWTAPAPLGITGLPDGGRFNGFAVGSGKAGRIDVLAAYTRNLPDGAAEPVLYDRSAPEIVPANPTTVAQFAAPAGVATVATGGSFSHLRAMPDRVHGGLVAYWQQSTGVHNDVYSARFDPTPGGPGWAAPTRITSNPGLMFAPSVAIDTDGTLQTVYQSAPFVTTPTGTPTILLNGPADVPVGAPVGAGVATSSVKPAPEWAFGQGLFFPYADAAASGTTAKGQARIINRGTLAGDVQYQPYLGDPNNGGTPLGSPRIVHLGPGQTFDFTNDYTVQAGKTVYGLKLTPLNPAFEAITMADDVSTTTLAGKADLAVQEVSLSNPKPHGGTTVQATVLVSNPSSEQIKGFDVKLYQGDPALGAPVVWKKHVNGLGAHQTVHLTGPWAVPAAGGDITLTAVADSGKVIDEATEGNNTGYLSVSIQPGPTIVTVDAKAITYSGVNNVLVTGQLGNPGDVSLQKVRVRLYRGLDDGPLSPVGDQLINLPAGGGATVHFAANGLAGRNRYRLVVDPVQTKPDHDRGDDVRETTLILQGLPDLIPLGPVLVETQHPTQGQALTLRTQVRNAGIRGADHAKVDVFAGDPRAGGLLIGATTLDHIDALATATVQIPLDTTKLIGVNRLVIVVDRLEKILEGSDRNNTVTLLVTFKPTDEVPPNSSVSGLPAVTNNPQIAIHWQGTDGPAGGASGIAWYDVYASVDNGPFALWLARSTATSAVYPGREGHAYAFYSVATDNAGNREAVPRSADAQTAVHAAAGQIRGVAFNDKNGNRHRDAGEGPLTGFAVFLDANANGQLEPGEPSTQTDAGGAYGFSGLPVGDYTVAPVMPTGWTQTAPGSPVLPEPPAQHFLPVSGAGQHFAWPDRDPTTPAAIDIAYDFRSINDFANQITPAEQQEALRALQAWANATQGRVRFVRNTTAPADRIVNIGIGDLAAIPANFKPPGNTLGLGGATPSTRGAHTLAHGFAWLNGSLTWTTGGIDHPPGTYDFFTGVAHEIGHALGLADLHAPPRSGGPRNLMDDFYAGQAGPSPDDVSAIRAVYPAAKPIPDHPTNYSLKLGPDQVMQGVNFGFRKLPPILQMPTTLLGLPTIPAGVPTTIDLGSFTDLGGVGPWSVRIDWGDRSPATRFTLATADDLAAMHTFNRPGVYTVTVEVTDGFGATGYGAILQAVVPLGL